MDCVSEIEKEHQGEEEAMSEIVLCYSWEIEPQITPETKLKFLEKCYNITEDIEEKIVYYEAMKDLERYYKIKEIIK